MQRIGLTFGVIAGVLLSAFLLLGMVLLQEGVVNFESGEVLGYSSMLVALSVIFFGVKSYRDKHQNGSIRFWKAFRLGLLISAVGALMYAGTWEVYRLANPGEYAEFVQEYQKHEIDKLRTGGAPQEEIDAKTEQIASFMLLYENPVVRFGFTLLEPLPVAILVSLLSAAILRRRGV